MRSLVNLTRLKLRKKHLYSQTMTPPLKLHRVKLRNCRLRRNPPRLNPPQHRGLMNQRRLRQWNVSLYNETTVQKMPRYGSLRSLTQESLLHSETIAPRCRLYRGVISYKNTSPRRNEARNERRIQGYKNTSAKYLHSLRPEYAKLGQGLEQSAQQADQAINDLMNQL